VIPSITEGRESINNGPVAISEASSTVRGELN